MSIRWLRCALALVLVAVALVAGPGWAQQAITARSVLPGLDKLKVTYAVPNFRIGGKYDLAHPERWRP